MANLGRLTGGYNVAMSGLMLGQFKEPESDIKLSIYEGSWFGKICFKNAKFFSCKLLNVYEDNIDKH